MTRKDRPQNTRINCEFCDRINTHTHAHTHTHTPKTWKQNQPSLLHRWTVENIEGQINYGPHAHIHVNVHKNKLEHAHTKNECPSKQTSTDIPQFWCFRLYNLHNRRWQTRISHWWDNVMKLLNDGHQTPHRGKRGSTVVRAPDSWPKGRGFESRQENFLLNGRFSGLTLISVSAPPLYYRSIMHVKDPGHFAKSAGGRLQLNTHAPYVCGFAWSDVIWCMLYSVHRTRRDGSSFEWHQPSKN